MTVSFHDCPLQRIHESCFRNLFIFEACFIKAGLCETPKGRFGGSYETSQAQCIVDQNKSPVRKPCTCNFHSPLRARAFNFQRISVCVCVFFFSCEKFWWTQRNEQRFTRGSLGVNSNTKGQRVDLQGTVQLNVMFVAKFPKARLIERGLFLKSKRQGRTVEKQN